MSNISYSQDPSNWDEEEASKTSSVGYGIEYPNYSLGEPPPAPPPVGPQPFQVRLPKFRPLITYTIMVITILVFLAQIGTEFILGVDYPAALGAKINEFILFGQWWRLFTPMLLHGSFIHIGFNMYALYIIGPELERFFGKYRYIALYLLSGFAGNVLSMLLTPNPSLGSSTAIFGLIGAQGVFVYLNRELMGERARRALRGVIQIALINFIIGLSPGIDNWGHLGGMIGGVLFTWLGGPLLVLQGIQPNYKLEDRRESRQVVIAAVGVGLIFSLLALGVIFWF